MEARFGRGEGGWLIKECREVDFARTDVKSDEAGGKLWKFSEGVIEEAEKEGAVVRALEKKAREAEEKETKDEGKSEDVKGKKEEKKKDGSRRSRKAQK
jgi:hypothetical protein